MTTPNIIFKLEYNLPYDSSAGKNSLTTRRDFVSCNSKHNLYNYLTRPSASDKTDIETIRIAEQLAENTEITERDLLEYASNRKGSTGAFFRAGDLSPEMASELKSQLRTTQSIIWTAVLSFEEDYGRKFCNTKAQAQELIVKTLPALFSKTKLKYDNIEWYGALHENTDNRHIHLCFWEKEPTFTRKGSSEFHYASFKTEKISTVACDNFKFAVAKFCDGENLSSFSKRDVLRKDFRQNMNTERKKIAYNLLLDGVKQSNSWQYTRQSKDTQSQILAFAMDIIRTDEGLQEQYLSYIEEVQKQQQSYFEICKKNNISLSKEIQTFAERNVEDLHVRLGNDVLSSLKKYNEWIEKKQSTLLKKQGNKETSLQGSKKIITKNSISTKTANKLFSSALKLCLTSFDNSFNQFRNAIKEQEHKRKQFEGAKPIYE